MSAPRPSDNDRAFSYGVTPAALKEENASQWSQGAISGIQNVQVDTPRGENLPAASAFSPQTSSEAPVQSTQSSIAQMASSGVSTISNLVGTAYNSASSAISSDPSRFTTSTVPEVVEESQRTANQPGEASNVPSVVLQKKQFEDELLGEVKPSPATGTIGSLYNTASQGIASLTQTATPVLTSASQSVGQAIAAATQSAGQAITTETGDSSQTTTSTTPATVRTSQLQAAQPAEASGVPEVVLQKQAVEEELLARPAAHSMDTQGTIDIVKKIPGGW